MIVRVWHGWTSPEDADAYQLLLANEIVPGILARGIVGLRGVDVLRARGRHGTEIEFVTIMTFDDWPAVETFAGAEGTAAVVPDKARELLTRFSSHPTHYDLLATHRAGQAI